MNERPFEIHFPLESKDILKLLQGVEYNQILTMMLPDNNLQRIHVRVYTPDRVKNIAWDDWRKIVAASYYNPELRAVIESIEHD